MTNPAPDSSMTIPADAGPTRATLTTKAGTNPMLLRKGPCRLLRVHATGAGLVVRYLKFYDLSAAPAVGTDAPVLVLAVPVGGTVQFDGGRDGDYYENGLAMAITGAANRTNTTAVLAEEVFVHALIR